MPNLSISDLPIINQLNPDDIFPVVQTGVTHSVYFSGMTGYTTGASGSSGSSGTSGTSGTSPILTANYVTVTATTITVPLGSTDFYITGLTITTSGNPVLLSVYTEITPNGGSGYGAFAIERLGNHIGNTLDSISGAISNACLSMTVIDNPPSGTHIYNFVCHQVFNDDVFVGNGTGANMIAYELR